MSALGAAEFPGEERLDMCGFVASIYRENQSRRGPCDRAGNIERLYDFGSGMDHTHRLESDELVEVGSDGCVSGRIGVALLLHCDDGL